jgi:hypothetical protein
VTDDIDAEVAALRAEAQRRRDQQPDWDKINAEAEQRRLPQQERPEPAQTPQPGDATGLKIEFLDTVDPEVRRLAEQYAKF